MSLCNIYFSLFGRECSKINFPEAKPSQEGLFSFLLAFAAVESSSGPPSIPLRWPCTVR